MKKSSPVSFEGLDAKALRALSRAALKEADRSERQVTSRHPSIATLSDSVQAAGRELRLKPAAVLDLIRRRLRLPESIESMPDSSKLDESGGADSPLKPTARAATPAPAAKVASKAPAKNTTGKPKPARKAVKKAAPAPAPAA